KPRLFWSMLFAFVLVIGLGICGMLGFVGLAVSRLWQADGGHGGVGDTRQALAATLGDYYQAHGDSWKGVEPRVTALMSTGTVSWLSFALLDGDGRVLASTD